MEVGATSGYASADSVFVGFCDAYSGPASQMPYEGLNVYLRWWGESSALRCAMPLCRRFRSLNITGVVSEGIRFTGGQYPLQDYGDWEMQWKGSFAVQNWNEGSSRACQQGDFSVELDSDDPAWTSGSKNVPFNIGASGRPAAQMFFRLSVILRFVRTAVRTGSRNPFSATDSVHAYCPSGNVFATFQF